MILRGPQIHPDGHGKCGLHSNSTLSSTSAQLPISGVPANTRMSRCNFVISHRHFTPGGTARVRLEAPETISCDSSKMSGDAPVSRRIARSQKEVVMSHRYNIIDIIVGVGMCAIVFGASLVFFAANGPYQVAIPQPLSIEQPVGLEIGMASLQPALGQALVDQALFERRANQFMAQSASEWNRTTLAHQEFQSLPGGPLGAVMRQAAIVPADHMARVQYVLGRAIVNFTARGIRSGVLSADQYRSDYNTSMIRAIEAYGQRLDHEFASTWQATLGREIVDAIQDSSKQAGMIQERLGTAILHLTQAQTGSEEVRAAQQEQLASLIVAAIRTEALADRLTLLAAIESFPEDTAVASVEPASWPDIPVGYLIVAGLMLVTVLFGGLSLTARSREAKALAEMEHQAAKWVYRIAA